MGYENRLTRVVRPDGVSVNYKYDALGRRVERAPSTGQAAKRFVYDGQDVVRDINADGSTVDYLNGLGVDEKLRQSSAAGVFYFTSDHLGSTTALTDAAGNVVERMTYDTFGNSLPSARTRYGYTGREYDELTGLYYYRARWYDSQAGRFISEDPIGFAGGVNFYAYVSNNPMNRTDPSGLQEGGFWAMNDADSYVPRQKDCECLQPEEFDWWGFFWNDYQSRKEASMSPWQRQVRDWGNVISEDPVFRVFMLVTPIGAVATPARGPSFLGQANGPAIIVPKGAVGPVTIPNGKGFSFTGGSGGNGLSSKACNVRVMDSTLPKGPSPGYPDGYASYSNGAFPKPQTVNPYTGKTLPPTDPWWHIPLR